MSGEKKHRSFVRRLSASSIELIAPANVSAIPAVFGGKRDEPGEYANALGSVQRFRGAIYRRDGALPADALDATERHRHPEDPASWHLVARSASGELAGCIRVSKRPHIERPPSLPGIHRAIERLPLDLKESYELALRQTLESAQGRGWGVAEIGGWAVAPPFRGSSLAALLACSCWSLARLLDFQLGVATVTTRNSSDAILRQLGGYPLGIDGRELPPFFDSYFHCSMTLMAFDFPNLHDRYLATVDDLCQRLACERVIVGVE